MVLAGPHSSLYGWIYDIINLFIFCRLVLLGSSSLEPWIVGISTDLDTLGSIAKLKVKDFINVCLESTQ